jgi:predicted DNA-binding transcriptional regulator AlpA
MPARDEVRDALKGFVIRACEKESLTDDQLRAVEMYLNHFGSPQPRRSRVEQYLEQQEQEVPSSIPTAEPFPYEGLVTGEEAARFLGYGDFKHPGGKVLRLANEGALPPPVRKGNRAFRWEAKDIRQYKDSVTQKGGKAA